MGHRKILTIDANDQDERAVIVLKSLASEWRLRILRELGSESRSVTQLASALGIPPATATMHIRALEEGGLIATTLVPATRGLQKVCSRTFDQVVITLPSLEPMPVDAVEVALPIGSYVNYHAVPTCGLASENALIGMIDDPTSFLEPERLGAQIIWFHTGFVEYRFPYRVPLGAKPVGLQVRMEVCSESPMHNDNWPSDITLWVNGIEVGTWTCPGDYGGTRGALTPNWWLDADSQFGLQKRWEVNPTGTYIDSVQISDVSLLDLQLDPVNPISIRVGVKEDARHANGINLFGRRFGNYPEDLVLRITYDQSRR